MAQDDDDEDSGPKVPPLDLAKSYGAFVLRSLRRNRRLAIVTTSGLALLTAVAAALWPRTYTSTTVLAAMDNRILEGERSSDVLRSAQEVILSRDNVAKIAKDINLTKRWEATMPPLSRFKQGVMNVVRGEVPEEIKREVLISMAQSALIVTPPAWNQTRLTISADWNDAQIAADLADAAEKSFLQARQVAEIATISEYITILEGHANDLRTEIQKLAGDAKGEREAKLKEETAALTAKEAAAPPPPKRAVQPMRTAAPAPDPKALEALAEVKAQLDTKQRALKDLEEARQRRLADAQAALSELRSKFTPSHPMVEAAEANINALAADTGQLSEMRSDIAMLQASLKSKQAAEELVASGGPRVAAVPPSSGVPGASGVEPLPADIMRLLDEGNEELDPAVAAQFRGAVAKYATLRDKIGTARLDLDTAQAAFKHRYQVVFPADRPNKPSKPVLSMLLAVGFGLSLGVGWLLAILAELKKGRVVERWQVYRLGVPLLGEVRWPPSSDG